jgi:putative glutamine amidotransferase
MRIFSAGYGTGAGRIYPFGDICTEGIKAYTPKDMEAHQPTKDDLLIIWGGADISPSIYGMPNVASFANDKPSRQDQAEIDLVKCAQAFGVPILGVCRGAQLVCAMSGGKLAQHVDRHGGDHEITTDDKRQIITSSVHHQMMYPFDVDHRLIAWSTRHLSSVYEGLSEIEEENVAKFGEPEIVWFPKTKSLAVQGHPEFMPQDCEFNHYVKELIHEYC